MRPRSRAGRCGLLLLALLVALPAHAGTVAVTFDDLPLFGHTVPTADAAATTRELLAGLRRERLPATGFVNEIKLDGADRPARIALLEAWLDAGMALGNHGYSHLSLTAVPVETVIADVARGDAVTRALLARRGQVPRWYRPPYLETGPTPSIRARFDGWLAGHGYRVAPVTMENSDWLFTLPYDDALQRRDAAAAHRIQAAYLAFTARIVPWYVSAAREVLGREPAFVMLLHASRLNADSIAAVAAILHANRLRGVTLDRAMRDPAYAIADDYAGPRGDQWITRWARTLGKPMPWGTLPRPPATVAAEDARLDALPH